MGCPATSVTINQRSLTLQKDEDHIYVAAEAKNHEKREMYSDLTKIYVQICMKTLNFEFFHLCVTYLLTYLLHRAESFLRS
jgi:hypothetical protein